MNRWGILWVSLTLVSCAGEAPPRAEIPSACRSEVECAHAYQEARARAARCHGGARTGIHLLDAASKLGGCDGEDASARAAGQRLAWFQTQARAAADAFARRQQWEAQERARIEREKAEAAMRDVLQQRIEAAWLSLDVRACSVHGDSAACDDLARFIADHPGNPHQGEAAESLRAGRDKAVELRAKAQEAEARKVADQKREDAARAQEAARAQAVRAKEVADARSKAAEMEARAAARAACHGACKNKCAAVLEQAGFQACLQACTAGCQ
ncbi:large Ala/Glu-rich protein [Minicystis rosea]|nr:large Ala/Glu-rich protein [Minicystis rosea]